MSYTISKSMDDVGDVLGVLANDSANQQNPFDNRNNRAVSAWDAPQRLVITHQFAPVYGQSWPAVWRHLLAGWEFSGIFQAQSGLPANLFSGNRAGLADPTLLGGNGAVRPNLLGQVNLNFEPNPGSGSLNPNKVTASGLGQPLVGQFGTLGRNAVRLNPLINTDWTVGKTFRISERFRTQFQAQFFNMFNNTTFSRPGVTLSGPSTFGYYADTDFDPRNITLVLRFTW